MGLRRKLYSMLGGDRDAPPITSTEPYAIGYVPLWKSEMLATRLREDGFHAHAVGESRADPVGRIPLQPMAHIFVPRREAADGEGERVRLGQQLLDLIPPGFGGGVDLSMVKARDERGIGAG